MENDLSWMKKDHSVRICSIGEIDVGNLRNELFYGELYETFKPEETIPDPFELRIKTGSGEPIWFSKYSLTYFFAPPFEEGLVLKAISSATHVANQLKSVSISFNPNFLDLHVGHFRDDKSFERDTGHIARNLQTRLYGGGSVGYTESSQDYGLYLGTESEIDTLGPDFIKLRLRKIKFQGTANPANSLDELLARIEQNQQ